MLVHTREITQRPQGGVDLEEIISSIILEKSTDELFEGDCKMNSVKFVYSVVNPKRRTLVGALLDENGSFQQMSLHWAAYPCHTEHVD